MVIPMCRRSPACRGLPAAQRLLSVSLIDAADQQNKKQCVGLEAKPQANGLTPLASEGACLNYCGR